MRTHLLAAVAIGLVATPAAAQEKGTWELGGFGRFTSYDNSYDIASKRSNSWGGGGRLGYFVSPKWSLEVSASGNASDLANFFVGYSSTALTYYPVHLRLLFNQRLGEGSPLSFLLGAGPGYARYGKDIPGIPGFKGSDWAGSVLVGLRANLARWLALRVDGSLDFIPSPNNGSDRVVNQGQGLQPGRTPATSNINLAAQGGLSIFPNTCNKRNDGTTISPGSAAFDVGGSAGFTASATNCGKADQVVYSMSGPGSLDAASGRYTSNQAGSATVTACGVRNKRCSTANVTVRQPPPPPPPPTLQSVEVAPEREIRRIDQPVTYTITGRYTDGATRAQTDCRLASEGAAVDGYTLSWSTPGLKTVTATCGAVSGTASVDVEQIQLVVSGAANVRGSAFFEFDRATLYQGADVERLRAVATTLKENPEIKLVIDGHTDAVGTVAYNARLGLTRAGAIREFLSREGVPVDRMTIVLRSFGECQPVAANNTAATRAQNRRAEIREFGNTPPGEASGQCPEGGTARRP